LYKVESLGEIIALRKIDFLHDDGKRVSAEIKVGKPVECDDAWCCPYEISTGAKSKLGYMVGIDSLQALELSMKTLRVEVNYWEKTYKCKAFFLEEEGAACDFFQK